MNNGMFNFGKRKYLYEILAYKSVTNNFVIIIFCLLVSFIWKQSNINIKTNGI